MGPSVTKIMWKLINHQYSVIRVRLIVSTSESSFIGLNSDSVTQNHSIMCALCILVNLYSKPHSSNEQQFTWCVWNAKVIFVGQTWFGIGFQSHLRNIHSHNKWMIRTYVCLATVKTKVKKEFETKKKIENVSLGMARARMSNCQPDDDECISYIWTFFYRRQK